MRKTQNGPYHLIPEWEEPEAVALIYPCNFSKYNICHDNITANQFNMKHIVDDFNVIVNKLLTLKKTGSDPELSIIVTGRTKVNVIDFDDPLDIKYHTIPGLSDIWIKDFAPVPARTFSQETVYIKPVYSPSYLTKTEARRQHKAGCELARIYGREIVHLPLVWDIGNLTHNGLGTGIVTKRIIRDNPELTVNEIRAMFSSVLGINNLVIINEEPGDYTGHVDGTVRFISHDTVAISQYPPYMGSECRYIESIKKAIIKQADIKIKFADVPNAILCDGKTDGMYSAFGNHINFLWIGKTIFIPVYNIPSDIEAYNVFSKYAKDCTLVPVPVSSLSHFGGVLNCMTWKVY
ncbi:MAG TPA: agmatine deiminase family protein [Spirochaetota bacterium]|nr:agmatine deiminase family protein [Spirochaetota bacterium]